MLRDDWLLGNWRYLPRPIFVKKRRLVGAESLPGLCTAAFVLDGYPLDGKEARG